MPREPRRIGVLPTTQVQGRLTDFHVLTNTEVLITRDDCYPVRGGGWGLTKSALMKAAQAAGITFDPKSTGIIGVPTADYLAYRAVAQMSLGDGRPAVGIGSKEWFSSTEHGPGVLENRLPMTETKAMLRAIRALLAIKTKYTNEEMPEEGVILVIPRVEYVPDINNPNVRAMLMSRQSENVRALYGAIPDIDMGPALMAPTEAEDYDLEVPTGEPPEGIAGEVVDEDEDLDTLPDTGSANVPSDNPGDYVIEDEGSTFKGHTLDYVEARMHSQHKGSYCRWILTRSNKGSESLREACRLYVEAHPDAV